MSEKRRGRLLAFSCSYCSTEGQKLASDINRANKGGYKLFCDQLCAGKNRSASALPATETETERKRRLAVYRSQRSKEIREIRRQIEAEQSSRSQIDAKKSDQLKS